MNVAIKIIPKTKGKIDEHTDREIKILSSLKHQNIMKYYSIMDTKDYLYLFTELLEGGSLRDLIIERYNDNNEYLFKDNECATIMKGLVDGLYYLHSRNIMHRDIKTENIMFRDKDDLSSVTIVDFGLATYTQEEVKEKLRCGTTVYMAPEIINKEEYDQSVDIWAAGIVLYILCSGGMHPLFNREMTTDNFIELLNRQKEWVFPETFSLLARNLLFKLCKYTKTFRYQANNALKHPWLTRSIKSDIPTTLMDCFNKINLKKKFRSILGASIFLYLYKEMNKDQFPQKQKENIYISPPAIPNIRSKGYKLTILDPNAKIKLFRRSSVVNSMNSTSTKNIFNSKFLSVSKLRSPDTSPTSTSPGSSPYLSKKSPTLKRKSLAVENEKQFQFTVQTKYYSRLINEEIKEKQDM